MINFDDIARKKIKKYNQNWLQIPDHPYRILIIGGSESGKTKMQALRKIVILKLLFIYSKTFM